MLSHFRNFTKSRFGLIAVFVVLGVIAIAFAAGDITGLRSTNGGSQGTVLAKVGSYEVTDSEVRQRIEAALNDMRRGGQAITTEDFLRQGGFEMALDQAINGATYEEFSRRYGIRVSKALVDGEIASAPALQGIDGKFDQKKFDAVLAERRLTAKQVREDLARSRYGNWLFGRFERSNHIPDGVIAPYASLLLERRTGIVGMVRVPDMDPGPNPDDKTLAAYYNTNRARYMVPERRVVRYSIVRPEQFQAQSAATEAEIAQAFRTSGTRFAATEKRSVRQLVLADQAAANSVAAKVKGGQSLAEAATAAGLETSSFEQVDKATLTRQAAAPAIADAAFSAAQGAVIGPIRTPVGWAVVKVESIEKIPAKTLDQARPELAQEISRRKLGNMLATLRQSLEDGIGDGETFEEVLAKAKLAASTTPALTQQGLNPDDSAYKPDPALAPIVQAGFAVEPDDQDPQVVAMGTDGSYAVAALERVVPAAPRPLQQIREQVNRDYLIDKALQKARMVAQEIVKQLERGVPMQQALAAAKITQPPPKPFDMKRSELAGQQVPPQVAMAFTMAPKKAKLVPAPERGGFYIVYLDQVEQHDAASNKELIARGRTELGPQFGGERARQFLEALKKDVKVTRNESAIARFKADLTRSGSVR